MNIFVAGASGAIGKPLITELIRRGYTVTGMSRPGRAAKAIRELGANVVEVDAFDAVAVEQALHATAAEVVIDELTSLPQDPRDFPQAFPGDRRLRIEGGGNLHRAAMRTGVRRYLQQSSGFFLRPEPRTGWADESSSLLVSASPGIAASAQMYAEIESRLRNSGTMETVALRYGFFYGPNTWYQPTGAVAEQVRQRQMPIIGRGEGVWSFVQVEDAARATVAAISGPPGVYNIVDDNPSPVSRWLPAFARFVGAPAPPQLTLAEALQAAGEDAVFYGTRLTGATNAKAKAILGFKPRRLEWLSGTEAFQ